MTRERWLLRRIRWLLALFITGLVLSGLTAFPLQWEMDQLVRLLNATPLADSQAAQPFMQWVSRVRDGLAEAYTRYPFIAYGTDWLAFAHLVIALAFIGPYRDPVRNIWVVEWGMLACVLVIPLALIAGPVRDIPFFHRVIDSCFGLLGIIPLALCRRHIHELALIQGHHTKSP